MSAKKGRLLTAGKIVLGLAGSGVFGWLAARGLDWGDVGDALEGLSPVPLEAALTVFLLASYLRVFRWKILFVNESISTGRLFIIQNEGIGINNVMPVRVASEPTQLAILTLRDGVKASTALATLGMERVIDGVARTLILIGVFFLVPEMKSFTLYVWGTIGFTVVAVVLVRFLAWGSDAVGFFKRIRSLESFALAVRDLERERARLAISLTLTVGYWLMVGVTAWIVAVTMDLAISLTTATLVIIGAIFFATFIPAAPGAIGTFEFAVIYVLEFFGVDGESGLGLAIVTHVILFLPPMVIAAIFLPREGIVSADRIRGLASRVAGIGRDPVSR